MYSVRFFYLRTKYEASGNIIEWEIRSGRTTGVGSVLELPQILPIRNTEHKLAAERSIKTHHLTLASNWESEVRNAKCMRDAPNYDLERAYICVVRQTKVETSIVF